MAEFNATVSETLRVFGVAPSNKWGDYAWNAFLWGEGTAQVPVYVFTGVSESQSSGDSTDSTVFVVVSEGCSPSLVLEHVNVLDEQGYYHVFPDRTTDGEGRDTPSWSSGAVTSASWTRASLSAPTWS
jgi:hypothetical protein